MDETLLKTPLADEHVALGARMVPFAGWFMPEKKDAPGPPSVVKKLQKVSLSIRGRMDYQPPDTIKRNAIK